VPSTFGKSAIPTRWGGIGRVSAFRHACRAIDSTPPARLAI